MNTFTKIILGYMVFSMVLFGVFELEADNIKDQFYNNRVNIIKSNLSQEEISGFSFAYGVNSEQCFNILKNREMTNQQYLNCKSFIDDLHSTSLTEL